MTQVKSYLAQAITDNGINVLRSTSGSWSFPHRGCERINGSLGEYGLTMLEFYASAGWSPG